MIQEFKQSFEDGTNLDADELRIKATEAYFIKNLTANVNVNPNADSGAGFNMGVYTPLESNQALGITLPGGDNYCCGFYSSEQTNEGYAFVFNSVTSHTIWVINGNNGTLRKVFQGSELPFILDPAFFIGEGMCTLFVKSYMNPNTNAEDTFKFLEFTNDNIQQYFISVEDSIATNFFTTSYFAGAGTLYDRTLLFHLGVQTPIDDIGITKVAPVSGDLIKQNLMVRSVWQFRTKRYDVWGRPSLHGKISEPFITLIGGGCLTTSNGLARCVDLDFDAGPPTTDRIDIEFRKWIGDLGGEPLMGNWQKYDTIYRWDNSAAVQWYNRVVNPKINYNGTTNRITYRFCADKNCEAVDPKETLLFEPGLPRFSRAIAAVNKENILGNNTRGFEPVRPDLIYGVDFSFVPPAPGSTCPPAPMRTIVVYAELVNPFRTKIEIIRGIGPAGGAFGWGVADCPSDHPGMYDQIFGDQVNPGFIGYMAGMSGGAYSCISEQVDFDPSSGTDTFVGYKTVSIKHYALQKFTLTVPAGKYLFRIASHKAKITDADFQKTSTYVLGLTTCSALTSYYAYYGQPYKEWEIDCTGGDVILNQPTDPVFQIMDMTYESPRSLWPCLLDNRTMGTDGYLVEDLTGSNIPIEMNPVLFTGVSAAGGGIRAAYGSFFTDHNGFFFAATKGYTIDLYIETDDCSGTPGSYRATPTTSGIRHGDGTGVGTGGDWRNKVSTLAGLTAYNPTGRRTIKGNIALCSDHSVGIPGIPVLMTKGGYGISDVSGNYIIIAHNRYSYTTFWAGHILPPGAGSLPDFSSSPFNKDDLIFSQKGGCAFTGCGGCTYSVADVIVNYIVCGGSRIFTAPNLFVNVAGVNIFGVSSGARYPVGWVLYDKIGRRTYVQVKQGDDQFVLTPNINDTGYRQFALGNIAYNIPAPLTFGDEFTHWVPVVAENTIFRDDISWCVDWVQFVDQTGTDNPINPTQIRIYVNSITEYNKQNNFVTNTAWDFLANSDSGGDPIVGDVIQFIMNGDGSWFTSVISAFVSYAKDNSFITIDYTVELAGLINGALFRIIRPKNCTTNYIYYECGPTIKLQAGGILPAGSGTLTYFDAFMLSRQIPVPVLKGQPGAIPPGGIPTVLPLKFTSTNNDSTIVDYSQSNVNSNNVIKMELFDAQTSFPFFFESPSCADTWGDHVKERGRMNVVNPNECQQRIGTEICKSGVLSEKGVLNFLGYFTDDPLIFDRNTWGNIISLLVEVGRMLVICDNDHFITTFNDNQVNQDQNGNLRAMNAYGEFSAPQRLIGKNYGCSLLFSNTIKKYAGQVVWLDPSGYLVFHNFNSAKSFTVTQGWLNNKIATMNVSNLSPGQNGITYPLTAIDPKTNEVYLTIMNLPAQGVPQYINSLRMPQLGSNETLIYDLGTGIFKGFASFTPEFYGIMPSYYLQKNMFSFKQGIPYSHHNGIAATSFNNFYGVQCKKMIGLVVNPIPEKVKRFLYVEVYCKEHKFIASNITTESGQLSNIPAALWHLAENFWMSQYFCDLNTRFDPSTNPTISGNPFHDGDMLFGRWLKQFFESADVDDALYCEISAIASYFINSEKSSN